MLPTVAERAARPGRRAGDHAKKVMKGGPRLLSAACPGRRAGDHAKKMTK